MPEKKLFKFYSEKFYDGMSNGSIRSAEVILSLLYEIYKPNSVLDIGCGTGSWLAVAESLGSNILKGLDGEWVTKDKLLSQNIDFTAINIEDEIEINEKYDLCISLEVAEHLSHDRAGTFINTLCEASNVVLFSSAVKYQGGTNHINEQWQSYWIEIFKANGFECYDIFRNIIWENDEVEWWYRQNIFLFINEDGLQNAIDLKMLKSMEKSIPNIIHPKYYEAKVLNHNKDIQKPSLRLGFRGMKQYILNKVRKISIQPE